MRRSLPENLQLDTAAGAAPLWAWIDAHQLQNTLLNLVLNARDATQMPVQAEGRIGVHASAQALDAAAAAALQLAPGRYVRIDVSDNGAGMDGPTLARVFEPFFTTKRAGLGTGLGLAMVYGFVKQSGGAVHIRSAVGQGTTVSLWLPACDAAPPLPVLADRLQSAGGQTPGPGLALLVDDDPAVRKVVRRTLLDLGFVVIEADNGPEAMDILDQTPGITLLLTDVVMPGGIDGRALAAFARSQRGVRRVVLMSGYAPDLAPGTDMPLLAKPFTRAQLAALLAAPP